MGSRVFAAVLALAVAGAASPGASSPGDEEAVVLLENARVLPVSGPEIPKGMVLLRGGKIAAVGAAVEVPAGARRVDLSGCTVCPGLVDAASRAGTRGNDRNAGGRDPDVPAADGTDLGDPAFAAARLAGVTSVVLSPAAPRGSFAGRLSLVKTARGGGLEARVADALGPVKAVLAPPGALPSLERANAAAGLRAAFRGAVEHAEARARWGRDLAIFLREAAEHAAAGDAPEEALLPEAVIERLRRLDPEPREAARKALRARLGMKDPEKPAKPPRRPQEPKEDPAKDLLLAAVGGEVGVRFEAHAVEDLRAALDLAKEFGLKATIEGGLEGARAAAEIAAAKVPLACWPAAGPGPEPAGPGAEALPAALVAAGARAAVATGNDGPLAVRHLALAAAAAAGRGLDRGAALRAVTLDAAAAAGWEKRIGSLEPGKDADLVVLDGDPLLATTRVLSVWIDGVEQDVPDPGARGDVSAGPGPVPAAAAAAPAAAPFLAVKARVLHLADGSDLPDAVVLVKDGRIEALGSGLPIPAGAAVLEAPVASAGFADLWTRAPGGNDAEDPRPFAPALRAGDGIDTREPEAAAAAREGVLARLLLPSDRNPAGGRAAAVRVAGCDGRLEVRSADAGGVFSITSAAARRERYPGSLAGILRGLDACFEPADGARPAFGGADRSLDLGPADRAALAGLQGGAAPSYLYARTRAEVAAALRFAAARRLRPVLVDPRCGAAAILEGAAAAGIAPRDLSAIFVLDSDDPLFRLRAPGLLHDAGAVVGFGSGGSWRGPGAVRRAAALATVHGMDPKAARSALLGRGFGGLRGAPAGPASGEPGDLVLLDGDPVEPSTRVLRVLAGGEAPAADAPRKSINE